jgi:hypothetical protein
LHSGRDFKMNCLARFFSLVSFLLSISCGSFGGLDSAHALREEPI